MAGEGNETAGRRIAWRDLAYFFAGVLAAPILQTLLYQLTPMVWPLWVPWLMFLAVVAVAAFILQWRSAALGMLVSSLLWVGFTFWLTAQVSPDW